MGGGLEGQGQWMYRLGLLGARIVLLVLLSLDAYYAHWFLGAGTPTWVVVGYGVWVFGLFVVPLHWHRWLSWANVRPLADVVLVSVLVIYSGGTSSPLYLLYAMPLNAALCRATRGGSRPAAVLVPLVFLVGYGGASVIAPWCDGPEPDWRLVAFRVVAFAVVLWVIARLYVDDDARLEGIAEGLRNVATRIESRDLATSIAEMVRKS
ncbi:MAG: hypothetical protein HYU66_18830 [Armatimonadetes bacterium]|nr:hypothetical protein [Armatimonadota bacterium]